jgi:hypothetical protein
VCDLSSAFAGPRRFVQLDSRQLVPARLVVALVAAGRSVTQLCAADASEIFSRLPSSFRRAGLPVGVQLRAGDLILRLRRMI